MRYIFSSLAIGGAMCALIQSGSIAQGTAEDYRRAAEIGRQMSMRVYKTSVKPHWIDADRFWYRNDLAGRKREFILVDAAAATRKPAFNTTAVAAALTKTLGRSVEADRLPVDNIQIDPKSGAITIQVGTQAYLVGLDDKLTPVKSDLGRARAFTPGRGPRRSGASADETTLTFVNATAGEVRLFWLDSEGARHDYGALKAGAQREMHTYATHVWLATDASGRSLVVFQAGASAELAEIKQVEDGPVRQPERRSPGVSPDGKWRAYIRDYNLYVVQTVQGASEITLSKDGTKNDRYEEAINWSPDSSHLLTFKVVPAQEHKVYLVESSPSDQLQPKLHANDYLKPGDQIDHPRPHLFDVIASHEVPVSDALMPEPWAIDEVVWDADSKRVTMLYNQRGHQVMRLVAIDAGTGGTTAVIDEKAKTFIDWTNKVYLNRLPATHEAVWMSERDGWNHLYLYDTRTGTVKNQITKGEWVVRGVDRVDPESRTIWFRAGSIVPGQDPYYIQYAKVKFDGTGLTLLTQGDGTHTIDYAPGRKYLVDSWSRLDMAPVTALRRADSGAKIMDLEVGDDTALKSAGYSLPERFVSKARDGVTDIYGVICRPSKFNPNHKYPVIENIYAGPQGSFVPKEFGRASGLQSMAELGFIVVQIDGLGTNNRSKAFHDVCWKNLSDAGFPDRILWIKAAAAKYPYMDLTRIGIYGTSAGGQNALGGMLLHGDFYKVGMADCGCHDNRMDKIWWNEQWMGWPVGPEYAANSNVTYASRLSGKLLLMVGEMDTNVDPASTMQVVNGLIKANKDFELLVMPGAGHGVAGTPYGRRRLEDFMVRNLLGLEPRNGG